MLNISWISLIPENARQQRLASGPLHQLGGLNGITSAIIVAFVDRYHY